MKISFVIIFVFLLTACGGKIVSTIPDQADPKLHYVFYSHGSGLFKSGKKGEKSLDNYLSVVSSIASKDVVVISEVRNEGTDIISYSEKVADQVNQLIKKGVPAKQITVSGFSLGATITMYASVYLQNADVNFIPLAGCKEGYDGDPKGRILALYDLDDEKDYESCSSYVDEKQASVIYKEVSFTSGMGHKFFSQPYSDWLDPFNNWIRGKNP